MELDQNENVVKTAEQDLTTLEQSTQQTHVSRDMHNGHGSRSNNFLTAKQIFPLVLCCKLVVSSVVCIIKMLFCCLKVRQKMT
jgi:hypothetical protein